MSSTQRDSLPRPRFPPQLPRTAQFMSRQTCLAQHDGNAGSASASGSSHDTSRTPQRSGSGQNDTTSRQVDDRGRPPLTAPRANLVPAQHNSLVGARWQTGKSTQPPAKSRPSFPIPAWHPPGDRITTTAQGHWNQHGNEEWVHTPRLSAELSLAAWHSKQRNAPRCHSSRPAVSRFDPNVPQTDVGDICEPNAATFKRPFPPGPGQDVYYSTDEVATFCSSYAAHRRTPPANSIPRICSDYDARRLTDIIADVDNMRVNGRPICIKWQLNGHKKCFEFCLSGLHLRERGCTANPNAIHICMFCCGRHSLVMCPHVDGRPHR